MGASFNSDINVQDPLNSRFTNLAADEEFVGQFVNVTDYTSVTVAVSTDQQSTNSGWVFEWSHDGVTTDQTQAFTFTGPGNLGGHTVHATVRESFFRVRYKNNSIVPTTTFALETLLRKGTPAGTVRSLAGAADTDEDAQTVRSVLSMRNIEDTDSLVLPFATGDPFVIVTYPPHRSTHVTQHVAATTFFSPQLDFFGIFANTRRALTVFNDTKRGNLFIDFSSGVTTTTYSWKVPPQHTWRMPESWINQSGGVWGRWDVGDGTAHVMEMF